MNTRPPLVQIKSDPYFSAANTFLTNFERGMYTFFCLYYPVNWNERHVETARYVADFMEVLKVH